jgi:hypothetical protein
MNAFTHITAADREDAKRLNVFRDAFDQFSRLMLELEKSDGKFTRAADVEWFALCNALIEVADDGDFMAARQTVMDDNGWTTDGYPADEQGNRAGDYRYSTRRAA